MAISVSRFRATCLDLIRRVESDGEPVDITRRGRVVARLAPAPAGTAPLCKPWKRLLGSGRLLADPEESVIDAGDFESAR